MKRKHIAFGLSVLLPGLGFAYLREWKLALVNFGVIWLISTLLLFLAPEFAEAFRLTYGIVVAVASGLWAYKVAERQRKPQRARGPLKEIDSEARF